MGLISAGSAFRSRAGGDGKLFATGRLSWFGDSLPLTPSGGGSSPLALAPSGVARLCGLFARAFDRGAAGDLADRFIFDSVASLAVLTQIINRIALTKLKRRLSSALLLAIIRAWPSLSRRKSMFYSTLFTAVLI